MDRFYDEFSKSLAATLPRRESLRRIGAVFAGAVLSPLGRGTAWGAVSDPCKAFCNRCTNTARRNQCLTACKACNGKTGRLAGSCGKFVCCATAACGGVCSDLTSDPNCGACGNNCGAFGETCCGNYCSDLANDFDNCGGCGAPCDDPGPFEDGACVQGACVYSCVAGSVDCGDGMCTDLSADPDNCGACGNVCAGPNPHCSQGVCGSCVGYCPEGWCGGDGCGGECACPDGWYCEYSGWCYPGCDPDSPYYPNC